MVISAGLHNCASFTVRFLLFILSILVDSMLNLDVGVLSKQLARVCILLLIKIFRDQN